MVVPQIWGAPRQMKPNMRSVQELLVAAALLPQRWGEQISPQLCHSGAAAAVAVDDAAVAGNEAHGVEGVFGSGTVREDLGTIAVCVML
jgi:hypothetical protein